MNYITNEWNYVCTHVYGVNKSELNSTYTWKYAIGKAEGARQADLDIREKAFSKSEIIYKIACSF